MSPRRIWDEPKPRLASQSAKRVAAVKADALTRTAVWRRQGGVCACCGGLLGVTWHLHHRLMRSQGGDDSLSNLIGLLGTHHASVHNHPARSYEHGYLVKSHDDPALIPLHIHDGRRVLCTPAGTFEPATEVA